MTVAIMMVHPTARLRFAYYASTRTYRNGYAVPVIKGAAVGEVLCTQGTVQPVLDNDIGLRQWIREHSRFRSVPEPGNDNIDSGIDWDARFSI